MAPVRGGASGRRAGAVLGRGGGCSTGWPRRAAACAAAGVRRRAGRCSNGCAATCSPAFPGTCRARPGARARRRRSGLGGRRLRPDLDHPGASPPRRACGWRGRGARIAIGAARRSALAGALRLRRLAAGRRRRRAGRRTRRWCASSSPTRPSRRSYDDGRLRRRSSQRNLALTRAPAAAAARHRHLVGGGRCRPRSTTTWPPGPGPAPPSPRALQPGETLITGGYRAAPAPPGAYAPDGNVYYNSLVAVRRDARRPGDHRPLRQAPPGAVRRIPAARPLPGAAGRPAAGPRRRRLHAGPAAAADRAAGRAAGAAADLLREPVPRLHPRRRASAPAVAPGLDRQHLRRRLVRRHQRPLAAPQPGQLPRHRGRACRWCAPRRPASRR